jgi:hypothetical protein
MADQRINAMFYRQFSDNANSINNRANIIARSNNVAPATGPSMVQSIEKISEKDKAKEAKKKAFTGTSGPFF